MKKLGEPSLDPPEGPDEDECQECHKPMGDDVYEVSAPWAKGPSNIYVCSPECASEYVQGWADHMYDAMEDSKWLN